MIKYLFVMRNNPCVLRTRKRNSQFKGNKWNCTSFVFSSRDCFVILYNVSLCGGLSLYLCMKLPVYYRVILFHFSLSNYQVSSSRSSIYAKLWAMCNSYDRHLI